jgi:hypothetical protein
VDSEKSWHTLLDGLTVMSFKSAHASKRLSAWLIQLSSPVNFLLWDQSKRLSTYRRASTPGTDWTAILGYVMSTAGLWSKIEYLGLLHRNT